ncbi:IS701 family transposase [Streptomyces purpureus]|uniref:Transposase IS701-like DDE domain-containing protein n=1 Tax=Streptomyces purpureus TaxID=1951 RepID=A0A918HHP3_9ACTN|nr:transposase [Streptomyces purpureus]GGT64138.1 hypothetical protein GCM10014713_66560 [Streptomyces purpureus]
MTDQHTAGTRHLADDADLYAYTDTLFGHLPRADQRRWAQVYLKGLLTTPGKKSVRRLAATVSTSPTASQSLQQFINASPWDWRPARTELARLTEQHTPIHAWTIGTAVLPKRGAHSCGVHRRFDPTAGRTVNCQVGLGIFLATPTAHIPVDWRLLLPDPWDQDPTLRQRTKIPTTARHRPLWAHTLDLVTTLTHHTTHTPPPLIADLTNHPDTTTPLTHALTRHNHDFILAIPPTTPIQPTHHRPPTNYRHTPPTHHTQTAHHHLTHTHHTTTHHHPQKTISTLIHLPTQPHHPTHHRTYRLFTQTRPPHHPPAPIYLTNLTHTPIDHLTTLTHHTTHTQHTLNTLQHHYGLTDFEGRSYPGWHHHMTLVSAAYTYHHLTPTPTPQPA